MTPCPLSGGKTDMSMCTANVRFRGENGHDFLQCRTTSGTGVYSTSPLIEQRYGARPASGAAFDLVGKAGDREAVRRKLFQVTQLLHVAIGNLATGLVTLPDN